MSGRSKKPGPPYLLDTHIWLWYLAGAERVPPGIRREIQNSAGDIWLSPISVWETGNLAERGRIELREAGLRAWVEEALRRFPLREASVNHAVAMASHEIELPHRDPADHLIAASALVYGLTLLTVDERLTGAAWLPTRSS